MKTIDSFFGKAVDKRVKHEKIEDIDVINIREEVDNKKEEENEKDIEEEIGMSEYEKVRIENIRRNEEFLLNLGLDTHRQTILVAKQGYTYMYKYTYPYINIYKYTLLVAEPRLWWCLFDTLIVLITLLLLLLLPA
jgi:hypothetical protein